MKIRRALLFLTLALNLMIISACGNKAARTVEYYDTHEVERSARIEECKKMDPSTMQNDKDCQAAILSWSKADNQRVVKGMKGMDDPGKKVPKGIGFKEIH